MQPGAKFQVELYESGPGYEDLPAAETPPVALDEGPQPIGIESSYQNMRIMLVPIEYAFGGCNTTFDVSEASVQKYEDAMFQQNGLESIEVAVHEPFRVDDLDLTNGSDFFSLLNRIVQLRAAEAPEPNVYYYGLFDNCGVCIGEDGGGCLLGVAPGQPGSSAGEAGQRAAIGTQFLSGSEVGIETFVHEIGHTQGRAHVACPGGGAAGTDPSYPHADGSIGTWGFGVRDFSVRNASTHSDYMSYCNPTWVSDWQWKATFERITELSAWENADQGTLPSGREVLVGAVNTETGASTWWTDRGWIEPDEARDTRYTIDFRAGDDVMVRETADVDAWSEGPWVTVRVPLVEHFARDVTAIEATTPSGVQRVEAGQIRRWNRALQAP
jgi:hypothetical protein